MKNHLGFMPLSFHPSRTLSRVLVTGLLGMLPVIHQAAPVTWGTPTPTTSVNDIDLAGSLVHAGSWGTSNLSVNVGGLETILFADRPINTTDPAAAVTANAEYDSTLGAFTGNTGSTNFNAVLNSFAGGLTKILTLENLVPGTGYQVQLFTLDERASTNLRTMKWSDQPTSGLGNESATFERGTNAYTTGTFTADGVRQLIYGLGANYPDTILNAYVLRKVVDAPPGVYLDPPGGLHLPEGSPGSYRLQTTTVPASAITVTVSATPELELSLDGIVFSASVAAVLNGITPTTVMCRGVNDGLLEPVETHHLSHAVSVGDGGDYTAATAIDDLAVTLADALMGQGGDLAVYTNAGTDDENLDMGASTVNTFSSTVLAPKTSYHLLESGQEILLSAGRHLVLYQVRIDHTSGSGRSEILSHLSLEANGIEEDLAAGWSQAFIRNQNGADEAVLSGGAIIQAPANAILRLNTQRSDTNTGKLVNIASGQAAIQLLKLDDDLDTLRLGRNTVITAPANSFTTIPYDQVDEASAGALGHTPGSGTVILNQPGHYLVLANTHLDRSGVSENGTRTAFTQRLLLDGNEVPGSKTTSYLRGQVDADSCFQGTTSLGMILESSGGQPLQVQVLQEGTQLANITGARTALSLVKLPDNGAFIRLEDSTGQDLNPATRSPLTFANQAATPAPAFSHSTSNSPVVIEQEGPYLFLSAFFCDNDTTARQVSLQEWTIDGIPGGYGGSSQYSRHASNFNNGNWSGFMGPLSVSNRVEVNASRLAAGGLLPGHTLGLQGAGIVSLSSNAVLVVKEVLGIAAGTIEIVGPQLLRAMDASAPASNIVYTVETDPTGGTLRNNGVALSTGDTFTQDDIDQGLLRFEAGTVLGSGFGFGFSLSSGGASHPAGFFLVTVAEAIVMADETGTSDEDSPVTTLDGGLGNLFANDSGDGLVLDTFDATSANGARVNVSADGTFSYDPSQAIALQALGNGETLMDPFTYTLVDAIGKSGTGTTTIAVGGVEDTFAAGDVVVDDSANRLFENAGTTAISIALAANDGIVRTANATTNDILICNYDARGSVGINTWQNLGSLGGADMDWILRPGITHDREVASARAGITAAYHWDGSPDATAILRGIDSIHDVLGAGVDQANASLEFWIKLDAADLGQVSTLFETGGGTGSGIVIDHGVLKAANGILIGETGYDLLADSLGVLSTGPTGEFFQVLWAMDLSNDVSSLYVNGVFVDSSPNTTTDWDGGDPSGLGHFQGSNHGGFQSAAAGTAYDTYYHGSMAIFRIYREALSPAEVFQNFQAIDSGATDMEGDTLSLLGLYNATGTLVPGTGSAISLASGGTVTLDTASGDFTYDPSGIPNLDDMSFGQSVLDTFTYRVGDGKGLSDDALVSLVIYGLNNAVDDTLAATETLVTTFTPNQLAGNDQHSQAAADPYLAFDAALVSTAEQAAGTWANAGSSGAASDATIWAGNLLAPPSGFGALAQSWDHLEASLASLDAISTQDATFELWFKPVSGSGRQVLFESGGGGNGMSLVYDADLHQVTATLDGGTDSDTNLQIRVSANGLSYERFNQLLVVYERDIPGGDGNDDRLTLYINHDPVAGFNPVPAATFLHSGGGVNDWAGSDGSGIGRVNTAVALTETLLPFAGQISRLLVYNRALSPAEMGINFDAVAQAILTPGPLTTALGATVTFAPDGSISYDASSLVADIPPGTVVQDSFTYTIADGHGGTSTGTVTIDVTGIGTFFAMDDAVVASGSTPVIFDPRTNDLGAAGAQIALQWDLAQYQGDFQVGTATNDPADFRDTNGHGWQYLWNAPGNWASGPFDGSTGIIGSTNDYAHLVWSPPLGAYLADGDGIANNAPPGNYIRLHATGGHPGPSASEGEGVSNSVERFVIAAYTVPSNGLYAVTSSTLTRPATGGNPVRVLTGVNTLLHSSTRVNPGETRTFDEVLGTLQAGDTIFVAVGPDANQDSDSFNWDFTISLVADIHADPVGMVSTDGNTITYDPGAAFAALLPGDTAHDAFGYFIFSGSQVSSARVSITLQGENDAPTGIADQFTTDEDTPLAANVLANDTDPDTGHAAGLVVIEVQGLATNLAVATATSGGGSVTVQADGGFVYDPNGAFESLGEGEVGSDSFSYRPADPLGLGAPTSSVVTITVTGLDDGVIAISNAYAVGSVDTVSGNLITDDTGSGSDISIDANDLLAVQAIDLAGTLGQVNATTASVVAVHGSLSLSNALVTTVDFGAGRFVNPVVIASPPTYNETEPTIVLVSNVNAVAGSFDIRLKEQPEAGAAASDADGDAHIAEAIEWIVLEAGSYQLANGRRMDVGTVLTPAVRQQSGPASWESVAFASSFETAPLVFHLAQTLGGPAGQQQDFFGTRMNGLPTTNGFQVAVNNFEGDTNAHTTAESIGWMAIEAGDGRWDGHDYEAGLTPASVTQNAFTINFLRAYGSTPRFIPAMETVNGADPTQLRMQNVGPTSAQVRAQEDTFAAAEITHAAEQVAYLALAGSSELSAFPQGATPGAFTYDPNGAFAGLAIGATATDSFTYVLVDENGNTDTNKVTITITGAGANIIAQWRTDNGFSTTDGSGPNEGNLEDKEADGLLNLLEFAFGTDPNLADNVPLRADINGGTFTPGRIITLDDGDLWGLFARRVDHVAAGLTYAPAFGFDLANWVDSAAVPVVVVADPGTGYELVAVPYTLFPETGEARSYFRVRVTYTGP